MLKHVSLFVSVFIFTLQTQQSSASSKPTTVSAQTTLSYWEAEMSVWSCDRIKPPVTFDAELSNFKRSFILEQLIQYVKLVTSTA